METNATDAYNAARERVDRQLRQVKTLLHAHAGRATANPTNRALIGDLDHVAEILNEAIGFLGGTQEELR